PPPAAAAVEADSKAVDAAAEPSKLSMTESKARTAAAESTTLDPDLWPAVVLAATPTSSSQPSAAQREERAAAESWVPARDSTPEVAGLGPTLASPQEHLGIARGEATVGAAEPIATKVAVDPPTLERAPPRAGESAAAARLVVGATDLAGRLVERDATRPSAAESAPARTRAALVPGAEPGPETSASHRSPVALADANEALSTTRAAMAAREVSARPPAPASNGDAAPSNLLGALKAREPGSSEPPALGNQTRDGAPRIGDASALPASAAAAPAPIAAKSIAPRVAAPTKLIVEDAPPGLRADASATASSTSEMARSESPLPTTGPAPSAGAAIITVEVKRAPASAAEHEVALAAASSPTLGTLARDLSIPRAPQSTATPRSMLVPKHATSVALPPESANAAVAVESLGASTESRHLAAERREADLATPLPLERDLAAADTEIALALTDRATAHEEIPLSPPLSPRMPRLGADADSASLPRSSARGETNPHARVDWLAARSGPAKLAALERHGGDEQTENAVRRGLQYLAAHQLESGGWGDPSRVDEKYGETMVGTSALALLAFLGAGHAPGRGSEHEPTVTRAIDYLLALQMPDSGHFGARTAAYSHGIATYALGEALLMHPDERVRRAVERGVKQILRHQQLDSDQSVRHGGWSYFYHSGRVYDEYPRVSVSVWQIMALKTASLAGIDVAPGHFTAANHFLKAAWAQRYGRFLYSREPQRLRTSYPTLPGSTPAAVFALELLGENCESPEVAGGVRFITEHPPTGWNVASSTSFVNDAAGNSYYWYYGTLAMFLHGGEPWAAWNEALKSTLLPSQARDGSWEPICVYSQYAGDTDDYRVYTTSLNVLMLEIYYRYLTPFIEKTKSSVGKSL
ncbi:MAG: prenyltransferase/squalene oxidase repeat-containing protein, partial [Planctomycetota bacterium]